MPINKKTIESVEPSKNTLNEESGRCACCSLFFSDYAIQELESRWNNSRGLKSVIKELLDEGFGHFAKPLLWRWQKLSKNSQVGQKLRALIDEQIWVVGESPTIHDFTKPTISDKEIERGVAHDLALLQRQWDQNEQRSKQKKKNPRKIA